MDLRSSDISTDSFRVSWAHPASDVVLYRLTWTPTDGEESNEVLMCCYTFILSLEDERKSAGNLMISEVSSLRTENAHFFQVIQSLVLNDHYNSLYKVLDWSMLKLNTC